MSKFRHHAEKRGHFAESLCVAALRLTGWRLLARRMTAGRGLGLGEGDIVAKRGRTLAFIEVKARAGETAALEFGDGNAAQPYRAGSRGLCPGPR